MLVSNLYSLPKDEKMKSLSGTKESKRQAQMCLPFAFVTLPVSCGAIACQRSTHLGDGHWFFPLTRRDGCFVTAPAKMDFTYRNHARLQYPFSTK